MHDLIVRLLSRVWKRRDIVNCDRDIYLRRWKIFKDKKERLSIYLHCFERSDEDRALHDHPWSFLTFILWRGYHEHTQEEHSYVIPNQHGVPSVQTKTVPKKKRKFPGMVCWRPATWKHRVELVDNKRAWTLVVRFARHREWGFFPEGRFVHWKAWWTQHCE